VPHLSWANIGWPTRGVSSVVPPKTDVPVDEALEWWVQEKVKKEADNGPY
jgi:hypothetical protein